jgi:cellulose synthase/poly-beta-1,6-N-acetylglucosamine synthase-like glycosyltransferase
MCLLPLQAGWFPDTSVTEDYLLSMKLKSKGKKGRCLYEHLATGLAPVEPRPWFQQRSRWTKGHFEVLFNSTTCPLAFWRYSGSVGQRLYAAILYMIGTWS